MNRRLLPLGVIALAVTWLLPVAVGVASDEEEAPRQITYAPTPPAPKAQSPMQAAAKSDGCSSCHTKTDQATMHPNAAVVLGCTDCHGGDARVGAPATLAPNDPAYRKLVEQAHVLPRYPESWGYPSSANPKRSYTLLNRESPEYVRFVNPPTTASCASPAGPATRRSFRRP